MAKTGETRRSSAEITKMVAEVNKLREGGMGVDNACEKVGISESVYRRRLKSPGVGQSGSVNANMIPPRPAGNRGGKRPPRPVNLNDVGSVAARISKIDLKIKQVEPLKRERAQLAEHLMKMLKSSD